MSLTPSQLDARRSYLGGTDLAALAGLNPRGWGQAIDVFADKRPDVVPPRPRKDGPMLNMGHLLEDVIAQVFTQASGIPTRVAPGARTPNGAPPRICPDTSWHGGNVDRFAGDGILECKYTQHRVDEWGPTDPTGTAVVVPPRYLVQLQWYLHVARRRTGYMAAMLGYGRFEWYRINRDDDLITDLVRLADGFWQDHVLTGVPPDPDGSDSYEQLLRRRYPKDDASEVVGTTFQQRLLREYRLATKALGEVEQRQVKIRQQIMDSMGEAQVLVTPDARVTWKTTKGRTTVDWAKIADELAAVTADEHGLNKDDQVLRPLVEANTRTHGTSRPFNVKYSSDGDDDDATT